MYKHISLYTKKQSYLLAVKVNMYAIPTRAWIWATGMEQVAGTIEGKNAKHDLNVNLNSLDNLNNLILHLHSNLNV